MKIAVCGSSVANSPEVVEKAREIGRQLAKKNTLVLCGAGPGYPYEAIRAAFIAGTSVIGISPAQSKQDHISYYKYPTDSFSQIEYTGMGAPARNYPLVYQADAIIIIGGQIGSLNEFSIAFHLKKPIGVLTNSGGITQILDQIVEICNRGMERTNVIFEDDPKQLVDKLVLLVQNFL